MSSKHYLNQTLIIIFFIGMSCEGNVTMFEETQIEKIKRELNESDCCIDKRNEDSVKTNEIRLQRMGRSGGKYNRIPVARTNNPEMLTEDGFEEPRRTPEKSLLPKIGNETKFIYKRQKIFFRKNFKRKKEPDKRKVIYLLGLFDLSQPKNETKNLKFQDRYVERREGMSEIWAAKLAVDHVNRHKLFGGYQIELYSNDTKCDPGVAVDALFHALFSKNTPLPILLGSACSMATASLASITPYWNIVQISFGATSPVLSNRQKFPMFYRVAAPESSHNAAKLSFIRKFGWNTVTFISQNEKEYILAVNYFIKILERSNITCKGTVTFGKNNFQDQLQHLKELDTSIIFGSFSEEMAPKIFCKVYELGVYGSNYAWILQGGVNRKWWKNQSECPERSLRRAVQGLFFITSYSDPDQPHSFQSNFTSKDLKRELSRKNIPLSRYAHESYDAIWTAATALNESLRNWSNSEPDTKIEDFNYDRHDMARTIFHKISLINSIGLSGPISFEGADRLGSSAFYQLQGEDITTVAIYLPTDKYLNFTCRYCQKVFWEGGQVPVSQRFLLRRIETISFKAFLIVACSTSIATVLAIFFLIFNSYFRKLKNIKLSSPRLNNIAVVGCIAVYIGVFLLGLDYGTLPNVNYYSIVCTAKVYFFAAGFSLAFGSIFAKTYRVHEIFIKSQGGFIKKKFLKDRQLILLVGVLLLIDGLILTVWVVLDPLKRQLYNSTIEYSAINRSVMYQSQIETCSCNHLNGWLSFLYIYKGLQLLIGVFLAWETRHVKIPGLNDSQYIVLSVYSVVITSCIVIVLANLIFEKPTIAYLIISTMILSSTTATLCLLFFPKVKIIFSKTVDNFDPIMHSMGLIMESNTRRFLMDDAKEKLYRLEVQNKVYKRDIYTLGNEISRLEKQLSSNVSLPNSLRKENSDQHIYRSLLEIPSDCQKPDLPFRFLTRSWPSEIHKISKSNRSLSFHSEFRIDLCPKNSMAKYSTGREKMKNFLKNTMNPIRRKEPDTNRIFGGGTRRDQRKFILSQYLPYIQKTQGMRSNEDLQESKMEKVRLNEKLSIRRKSQPTSRMRFKGSPRFPHRIVPTSLFIPEEPSSVSAKDLKELEQLEKKLRDDGTNVIIHQVEVLTSSDKDTDRLE